MTDDQVTGKTYFAQDTLGSMVDQIGTLDDAISSLDVTSTTLSDQKEPNNINPNTQTMANYEHLNQVLGVESLEMTDDGVYLNQEQIEAVNAALAPAQQEPAPAVPSAQNETTPEPATPQAAEPNPDPTAELRQQIEALTTALEEMRNAPGSKPAIVAPKADPAKTQGPNLVTKENGDFWENVKAVKANYL